MAKIERYSLKRQNITLNESELKQAIINYLIADGADINKDSKISIIDNGLLHNENGSIEVTHTTVLLPTTVSITIVDENPEVVKPKVSKKKKV